MSKISDNPDDFIVPLNINGLNGRMLRVPARSKNKNKEILLVYGHHTMLERWWGLVQNLEAYGNVTMPDLPGLGGMESFSKIRTKPTTDAYADYLAAFIKLKYRNKRVKIIAISFGFTVVTRMLQRYPELVKKVDILVCMVGFMHRDDFLFRPTNRRLYVRAARFFATRPAAFLIRYLALNKLVLTYLYAKLPNSKRRMIEVSPEEFETSMRFEVKLWQANDVRTHWLTTSEFLNLDNTKKRINLPVVHVVSQEEHYFNNTLVEQHMRAVFSDYTQFTALSKAHTPSVIADKKSMSVMLPPGLRRILNQSRVK